MICEYCNHVISSHADGEYVPVLFGVAKILCHKACAEEAKKFAARDIEQINQRIERKVPSAYTKNINIITIISRPNNL